jgi:G3E family GTPase
MSLLNTWPVPIKEDLEGLEHFKASSAKDDAEPAGRESPFFGVLRSKGFCWLAPTAWKEGGDEWRHDTAMYWSHAGKHFGIQVAGKWWATRDKSQIKEYFKHDPDEYERIINESFVSEQWGDRRQEIVFIGANVDQEKITKALDNCLVGEKGMELYAEQLTNSQIRQQYEIY